MRLGRGFGCWERENGRGEHRKVDIERVSVRVRMMWWPSFGQGCVAWGKLLNLSESHCSKYEAGRKDTSQHCTDYLKYPPAQCQADGSCLESNGSHPTISYKDMVGRRVSRQGLLLHLRKMEFIWGINELNFFFYIQAFFF